MNNLYRNIVVALSLVLFFVANSYIFYKKGYNAGVQDTQAEVVRIVTKQQESEIARANEVSKINNKYLDIRESAITKIVYKTKIIRESTICESNGLSKSYTQSLNNVLK